MIVQQINCKISLLLSQETCLAHIVKGLQRHLHLLNEISKKLSKTDQLSELKADIQELRSLIKKVWYLTWRLFFCE